MLLSPLDFSSINKNHLREDDFLCSAANAVHAPDPRKLVTGFQFLGLFGHRHISFNTVDPSFKDFSLILTSATKTFNIAGTKNSYVVIENPKLRTAFKQRQLANNQHEISGLGYIATEAAYRHGKPWLTELKQVFEKHIDYVVDELQEKTNTSL